MKPMIIMNALNDIDDEYIEKAAPKTNTSVVKKSRMPRYVGIAASIAVIFVAIVVTANVIPKNNFVTSETGVGAAESSSLREYNSLNKAEKVAGFKFNIPESYEGSTEIAYYADETFIEADYLGKAGGELMRVRKSSYEGDNSGDYDEYPVEEKIDFNGFSAIIKGDESGYTLATWNKDGYSYSISLSQGIQLLSLENLISSIS